MRVTRQHAQHVTLEQMREFVASSGSLSFTGADGEEIHGFVEGTWQARQYVRLSKKDKGVVRRYLAKISGRRLAQITRLIRRCGQSGSVQPRKPRRHRFPGCYSPDDMALLAAVDAAHEGLSGPAPRRICQRATNWREADTCCAICLFCSPSAARSVTVQLPSLGFGQRHLWCCSHVFLLLEETLQRDYKLHYF